MSNIETIRQKNTRQRGGAPLYALIVLLGLIFLCLYMELPPRPVASDAVETEFSAERAMQDLEAIAQRPHPTGSLENAKVRQYLVDRLEAMGVDTEVEHSHYLHSSSDFINSVDIYNVLGRIKGSDGGKQVVLMAHYDSVPTGPGANDNGVAVAALLEVARIIQAGPGVKNDILFAFTDAEEIGLIGAEQFWANPSRVQETGIVLNFEARGAKGPSLMFQTSPQNDWLIQEFAKVAPNPVTSSLLSSFYEQMPNDTDLTVAIEAGVPSMNFAYGQGWTAYHTTMDSIENVDLRTLQHHGENALALARHFGNADFNQVAKGNQVFFSFLGQVVHYPEYFVTPFTILLIVMYVVVLGLVWRKKLVSLRSIGFSTLIIAVSMLSSMLIIYPLWLLVDNLWTQRMTLFAGGLHDSLLYNVSFLFITVATCFFIWNRFRGKLNQFAVTLSAMFLWLLILVGLTFYLKGATYLFALPLLISLLILGVVSLRPQPDRALRHPFTIALMLVVPLILFTSVIQLLYSFLPVGINVFVNILIILLMAFLFVPLNKIGAVSRWTPLVPLGLALVLLAAGWIMASPSENRPVNSNLFYTIDTDTQEASWVSLREPNAWTGQYVNEHNHEELEKVVPGAGSIPIWTGAAPVVSVTNADVTVLEQTTSGGERTIHLNIKTDEKTRILYVTIPAADVSKLQLGEQLVSLPQGHESLYIKHTSVPKEGLDILISSTNEALELILTEVQENDSAELKQVWQDRPVELIPGGSFDGTILINSKHILTD